MKPIIFILCLSGVFTYSIVADEWEKKFRAHHENFHQQTKEIHESIRRGELSHGEGKEKLDNMNPQKLFNYILQNLETSTNVLILWDILCILREYKTQLVLYTYDSFLLDVDDDEDVLWKIREVFIKYQLNIKEIEGYDYNFTEES